MRDIVIFDLDGTLALCHHRRHLVECEREKQDWDAFYEACDKDLPNEPIVALYEHYREVYGSENVWIFSGRSSKVRQKTEDWLFKHTYLEWAPCMKMRPEGDFTPDDKLKLKWLEEIGGSDRIAIAFDDRDKVVNMWRSLGIVCCQVADGNF